MRDTPRWQSPARAGENRQRQSQTRLRRPRADRVRPPGSAVPPPAQARERKRPCRPSDEGRPAERRIAGVLAVLRLWAASRRPVPVRRARTDALPLRAGRRAQGRARWLTRTSARRHGEKCRRATATGRRLRAPGAEAPTPSSLPKFSRGSRRGVHVHVAASFRASWVRTSAAGNQRHVHRDWLSMRRLGI